EAEPARGEPDAPGGPRLGVVGRGRGDLGGLELEDRGQAGGDPAAPRRPGPGWGWSGGGAGTSAVSSSRIAARQAATERLSGGRSSGGRSAVRIVTFSPWAGGTISSTAFPARATLWS